MKRVRDHGLLGLNRRLRRPQRLAMDGAGGWMMNDGRISARFSGWQQYFSLGKPWKAADRLETVRKQRAGIGPAFTKPMADRPTCAQAKLRVPQTRAPGPEARHALAPPATFGVILPGGPGWRV